jgi:uncharacterized membrane protein YcjF (UPF0283 family)
MHDFGEPDLAAFDQYDDLLKKVGSVTLRDPVRRFYRSLCYRRYLRNLRDGATLLLLTVAIGFLIQAWVPDDYFTAALIAFVGAVAVCVCLGAFEWIMFAKGLDPADVFRTKDEELGIAHEMSQLLKKTAPLPTTASEKGQTSVGAMLFASKIINEQASVQAPDQELAPIAQLNQAAPPSSLRRPTGGVVGSAFRSVHGRVKDSVLKFNPQVTHCA